MNIKPSGKKKIQIIDEYYLENNNSSICLCSLGSDRIALGGKDSFLRIF